MEWTIANLEYEISALVYENVVKIIHWRVSKETEGFTANTYGTENLALPDATFIEFDLLEETTVLGWLAESMGEERIADIETALDAQLADQITPTMGAGMPWNDPVPETLPEE